MNVIEGATGHEADGTGPFGTMGPWCVGRDWPRIDVATGPRRPQPSQPTSGAHVLRDRLGAAVLSALVLATAVAAAAPQPTSAASLKVAIIVGPTGDKVIGSWGSQTDLYRMFAKEEAAVARAAGATVEEVYSPEATWDNVKTAVNGANVVIYHGHGTGFPNPYNATETTWKTNGWGLNRSTSGDDGDNIYTQMIYCGEKALLGTLSPSDGDYWTYCGGAGTDGITPAPNFVMIYANACYTAGSSELGQPVGDLDTARARVANFSYPVLELGANGYFATDLGATKLLDLLLRQRNTSFGDLYRAGTGYDAAAQMLSVHPDEPGHQIWVQKTYSPGLGTDYWYAFAGNPNATPANGSIAPPPPPPSVAISRYAGADRYATAAAVSAANFAPGTGLAYVATGANFPDALAAGAAAAHTGAPVLLVSQLSIPAATAAELQRLRPHRIVVVGGSSIVSDSVANQLLTYATDRTVSRIAGASRYETAAKVSANAFPAGAPVAYVATGQDFPDALAGVAAAGADGGPVLLVSSTQVPTATANELVRLHPGRIVILGSTGVVATSVGTALRSFTSGSVQRLAGASRYETAAAISAGTFGSADTVFLATGANFPDALGGGPVAGAVPGPLLLVTAASIPSAAANELRRLDPDRVVVLGGTGAVSDAVVSQVRTILGG